MTESMKDTIIIACVHVGGKGGVHGRGRAKGEEEVRKELKGVS